MEIVLFLCGPYAVLTCSIFLGSPEFFQIFIESIDLVLFLGGSDV